MTAEIAIVPLEYWHVGAIAHRIGLADRREIGAMSGMRVRDAIELSLKISCQAYAGTADGRVVCVFGLGVGDRLAGIARPWLLSAPDLIDHQRAFLRRNRPMVAGWSRRWRLLENYVAADNAVSIKWLGWLGFTLHPAQPYGPFAHPFHRFTMSQNQGDS